MIEEQFKVYIQHVSPLKEEVMNALNACFRKETLKKNEYFVREGAYAQQIAFVASGEHLLLLLFLLFLFFCF